MELVFLTKICFHYYLVLKMGLLQSLNFVDNCNTNPTWNFQHIFTACQIKYFWFRATLSVTDLKCQGKMFKLIPVNKKPHAWNVAFKKHSSSSSQRNNIIVNTLKAKHPEPQTPAASISFPYVSPQTSELSTGLLGWDRRTL